jgi:nitrate/nitrite transport system substrate-binding protein
MDNRPEQCAIVSKPTSSTAKNHFQSPLGKLEYGDGRAKEDELPMHFSKRNCNYPQPAYAKWWFTQFRRWGMGPRRRDYAASPPSCARTFT